MKAFELDPAALAFASRHLGLRRVVLFGSHATSTPTPGPDSDIDLAISSTATEARPDFWEIHRTFASVFADRPLDIVFLADADPLFRWEIVAEGVLLYGDPIDFAEYRAFAFRDFVDSADLRALERTLFEKKMAYISRQLNAAT